MTIRGVAPRGRRVILTAFVSLALAGGALAAPAGTAYRETADRVPEAERQAMVAGPMALVRQGDLAGGQQAFEALLARPASSSQDGPLLRADLLSAFGVALFFEDQKVASIDYLRRAIDAYRDRFGPNHAEVALALTDYAQVEERTFRKAALADVVPDLEAAYHMRQAVLGDGDAETVMSMAYLGEALGNPVRSGRDLGRIAVAADLIWRAHEAITATTNSQPCDRPSLRLKLARLYAQNGDSGQAWRHFKLYEQEVCDVDEGQAPRKIREAAADLRDDFLEGGLPDQADIVTIRYLTEGDGSAKGKP